MRLLRTELESFRNLSQATLEPGPRATVLVGENGQGKTNVLEAIYWSATLRPLRARRLTELIRSGSDTAEVRTTFELAGGPRELRLRLEGAERHAFVDGKKIDRVDEYFSEVTVVAFTPDDLGVVKGSPEERRSFLDRAVFARFPAYLDEARRYAKALRSRNRLLRDVASAPMIEAYDGVVAKAGARVWRRRLDLLAELRPHASRAFEAIAQLPDPLVLRYRSAIVDVPVSGTAEALEALLLEQLGQRLEQDRERRFTTVGPHADDLSLGIGDRAARTYASQGQQRALILALKTGEIENLREKHGRAPLLLLDDVSSELDPGRNRHLMSYLRGLESQVVLTTTDLGLVRDGVGDDAMVYRVKAGTLQAAPRGDGP